MYRRVEMYVYGWSSMHLRCIESATIFSDTSKMSNLKQL